MQGLLVGRHSLWDRLLSIVPQLFNMVALHSAFGLVNWRSRKSSGSAAAKQVQDLH